MFFFVSDSSYWLAARAALIPSNRRNNACGYGQITSNFQFREINSVMRIMVKMVIMVEIVIMIIMVIQVIIITMVLRVDMVIMVEIFIMVEDRQDRQN